MRHRTLDEMISYFNQQVSAMDIDHSYKIQLLGMVAAIGYGARENQQGEPMADLIERQAAIDVVKRLMGDSELSRTVQTGLHILPSAQPEIIRCKECKYSEHWYKDKRRCFLWHETGIDVFENGYCNYAERRTV